jgi:hypothetical protein
MANLIAHAANAVLSGGTVTPARDCTGANIIFLATATTFVGPTPTDSELNTYIQIGSGATHNTSFALWYCGNPTVSASQTFAQASNGSGFNQAICMAAFDGAVQVLGTFLDGSLASANGDPPTPAQSGSVTSSQNNCLFIALGVTEQGAGTGPTPDSGFIVTDATGTSAQGLTLAYLFESSPATLNPLWTLASGALHWGAMLQSTFNSAASVDIDVPVGALDITGYAPALAFSEDITVPVGALTITGYAPSLSGDITVPVGALVIQGYAPTLTGFNPPPPPPPPPGTCIEAPTPDYTPPLFSLQEPKELTGS